ncbi:MAG: hypothetical protein N2039_03275 [Gemmataceae bacterium]|nr:hypothetical protein [Gemmataceae bacterium]
MRQMFATGIMSVFLWVPLAAQSPNPDTPKDTKPDSHEQIVIDMLSAMQDATKALAKVQDAQSGKEAKPNLEKIAARMGEISKRVEKIGRPTKEQEAELEKKFKTAVDEAVKDFQNEIQRLLRTDYGKDVLNALEQKPMPPGKS